MNEVLGGDDGSFARLRAQGWSQGFIDRESGYVEHMLVRSIVIRHRQKPAAHQSTGKQRTRPDHEHYLFSEDVWQGGIAGSPTSRQIDIIRQGRDGGGRTCRKFRQVIMIGSEKQDASGTACQDESGAWKNHR